MKENLNKPKYYDSKEVKNHGKQDSFLVDQINKGIPIKLAYSDLIKGNNDKLDDLNKEITNIYNLYDNEDNLKKELFVLESDHKYIAQKKHSNNIFSKINNFLFKKNIKDLMKESNQLFDINKKEKEIKDNIDYINSDNIINKTNRLEKKRRIVQMQIKNLKDGSEEARLN